MDGIEAAEFIREWEKEQGRHEGVPIIALTANAVSGMKEMFMERGFNGFIAKPIDISKLDDTLDQWIPREKKISWSGDPGAGSVVQTTISSPQPPAPGSQSPLCDIPGLDVKSGLAMTAGSEQKYRRVLTAFCNDALKRLPFLQKVPEKDNMGEFVIQVHALKGAAASVWATEISAFAARLEQAGRAGNTIFIEESLSEFVCLLSELVKKTAVVLEIDTEEHPEAHLGFGL